MSLYAATKKSNELMAHAYSNLFNLPTTGLRFFTVYGHMGTDPIWHMLICLQKQFLKDEDRSTGYCNYGKHTRDFTCISMTVLCSKALWRKR